MSNIKQEAIAIINQYYYMLPNNGYINYGLLSCNNRYKEAIDCAIIGVNRIIMVLKSMVLDSNDPNIISKIKFYNDVLTELDQMKQSEVGKTKNDWGETITVGEKNNNNPGNPDTNTTNTGETNNTETNNTVRGMDEWGATSGY
jgi:hypothetical protein